MDALTVLLKTRKWKSHDFFYSCQSSIILCTKGVSCAVALDRGVTVMVLQGTCPSRTVLSLSDRRCCLQGTCPSRTVLSLYDRRCCLQATCPSRTVLSLSDRRCCLQGTCPSRTVLSLSDRRCCLQGTCPSRTVLSLSDRRCCLPNSAEVLFDNRTTDMTTLMCWLLKWGQRCQLVTGETLQTHYTALSVHPQNMQ